MTEDDTEEKPERYLHEPIVLKFGGQFPWGDSDVLEVGSLDQHDLLTLRLERVKR